MSEEDDVRVVIEAMAAINAMGALSEERRRWIEEFHHAVCSIDGGHSMGDCVECYASGDHAPDCSVPRLIREVEPHTTP